MELLLIIYEQLDLNSLAALGKTHPYNKFVTKIIFQNEYNGELSVNGSTIFDKTDSNNTSELDGLLNTLEVFGPLITKLNLNFYNIHYNENNFERLNEHINRYLADSLIEIQIDYFEDKHLKGLTGLKKVENVRLAHGEINTNLNDIFPAMRRLDPQFMPQTLDVTFEYTFPHLEELTMEFMSWTSSKKFERRIRLNPQLKMLNVWVCAWSTLKMINDLLPRLERFYVTGFDNWSTVYDEIHFDKLKAFGVRAVQGFPRDMTKVPIVFGNLEEIECNEEGHKCFDIIVANEKLRKIECGQLEQDQLQQIVEKMTHLEVFHTWHPVPNELSAIDSFSRIVELGERLKEVKAWKRLDDFQEFSICDKFYERLNDWTCVEENTHFVLSRH